jgi:hypothetical protein
MKFDGLNLTPEEEQFVLDTQRASSAASET